MKQHYEFEKLVFVVALTMLALFAIRAKGELPTCKHHNTTLTIQAGPNKGRTGKVVLTELVLGEIFHRIEIKDEVRVREEEVTGETP